MERYRVTRHLATGGMAEVYLGVARGAEGFEKVVAFKRMLPHLAANAEIAKMFIAEAQLARHLQHQNIVSVFDVGRASDGLFLVMEAVNGWDLGTLLDAARAKGLTFPPHLAAYVAAQVNAGLTHAYGKRVDGQPVIAAHRDISESNVLVSADGEVKVTDFGIARLNDSASRATAPGSFRGRVAYAAPELLSTGEASAASDQFALGVLLTELVTGEHPWRFRNDRWMAHAAAVSSTPPDLSQVPSPLEDIISRMLSVEPAQRYAPTELARVLATYLASTGQPAGPESLVELIRSFAPPPPFLERDADSEKVPSFGSSAFSLETSLTGEFVGAGVALGADGKVHGDLRQARALPPPPTRHTSTAELVRDIASAAPPRDARADVAQVFGPQDEPLELEARAPRPPAPEFPVDPPRRSSGGCGKLLAILAIIALIIVAAGVLAWPMIRSAALSAFDRLQAAGPQKKTAVLSIMSEPAGATVLIGGSPMGTTPLFTENVWPRDARITIEVKHAGYKTWKGEFKGGVEENLSVELQRARR